jgi:NTE family protein
MLDKNNKKLTVGLVLSGGGMRGFAHVGVIKALEEFGIKPDIISGVSAGSIVGALYADGHTPEEIHDIIGSHSLTDFARINIVRRGLFSIDNLAQILDKSLRHKTFEELPIPLYISATCLNDGKITYFHKGTIADKVVASSSIPVLFKPANIDGKTYVDGGIVENLPVTPIRAACDFIIGVSVNPSLSVENFDSFIQMGEQVIRIIINNTTHSSMKQCDLFIEPKGIEGIIITDMKRSKNIVDIGYKEAIKQLKQAKIKEQYIL